MTLRTVIMVETLLHLKFNYEPYFYLLVPDNIFVVSGSSVYLNSPLQKNHTTL